MIRLAIVVEGETEEAFAKYVLTSRLLWLGVAPTPILLGGGINTEGLAVSMANPFGMVRGLV